MFFRSKPLEIPRPEDALPGRDTPIRTAERHFVNGAPLQGPYPEGSEKALFGLGCFWGAEKLFWQLPGVLVSAVGYAGGHTPNPTYEEVCSGLTGHNEVVLVVYDPEKIGYERLLKVFWEGHVPTQGMRQANDVGTQYRSGIYVYSDAQRAAAEASRERYDAAL
ncbi:MAG: peptide-methionine (S)-S-oxide reductase MsrA, partial [Hoeflea sp.]|nr:peptide-methionine (S)-S-oxide reductase MsrA [Hoeflea sp.]